MNSKAPPETLNTVNQTEAEYRAYKTAEPLDSKQKTVNESGGLIHNIDSSNLEAVSHN